MRFQKELAIFKNKSEKLITISYENIKVLVENLEKEKRSKDNIDQPIQNIRHPQTEVSEDQEHASISPTLLCTVKTIQSET